MGAAAQLVRAGHPREGAHEAARAQVGALRDFARLPFGERFDALDDGDGVALSTVLALLPDADGAVRALSGQRVRWEYSATPPRMPVAATRAHTPSRRSHPVASPRARAERPLVMLARALLFVADRTAARAAREWRWTR